MTTSSSASRRARKLTPVERAEIIRRVYAKDPALFARDVLSFTAWSKQREIMEAVRDHQRVAVRSCHGTGKTAVAARVVLWFLASHPGRSRVVTTAPTWAQVADQLWREIRDSVSTAQAAGQLAAWPTPNVTKLDLGDQWFAIGHSTDQPERFQGHHADHLLLVVDEASGVDERIFEAAEGFLTAHGARVLLLGNPTRMGGTFHRAFTTERAAWHTIHISAFDSPNETGEDVPGPVARAMPYKGWAADRAKAWGEDSQIYQVRVLGNFATQGARAVISLTDVEDAQRRSLPADPTHDAVVIAADIARFGSDETVISERVGQRIRILETYMGQPTTYTTGRIRHHAGRHPVAHVRIVVDDVGVGGGVTDQLRAAGLDVTAFNGGGRAYAPLKYLNRRSELWFQISAQLPDLDLDPDEQLCADLVTPEYRYDDAGHRVVERKEETRRRLGRSPDRADAVMLTLVPGPLDRGSTRVRVPSITSSLLAEDAF